MSPSDIIQIRLNSQLLLPESGRSILEVVSRMGALQAQDFTMLKWAIGSRLPGSTEAQVEEALDRGDILRTHLLRPTWHVVSSKDIHWMLELTASRIRNSMKHRDAQLGLTKAIIQKSTSILLKALEDGSHQTKEELNILWNRASIPTTEYRDAHLLMHAELDGLICSGRTIGKNRSYALLDERAPIRLRLTKEEALHRLAQLYFTSRCPATLPDFIWWSGLTVGDAKLAVESIKPTFHMETVGQQSYLLPEKLPDLRLNSNVLQPISAFDEYIIAYKDRSVLLIPEQFQKVVSNNGIFRPALLLNGRVIGTWKRITKKNHYVIEVTPFEQLGPVVISLMEPTFAVYGLFLGKKIEVRIVDVP